MTGFQIKFRLFRFYLNLFVEISSNDYNYTNKFVRKAISIFFHICRMGKLMSLLFVCSLQVLLVWTVYGEDYYAAHSLNPNTVMELNSTQVFYHKLRFILVRVERLWGRFLCSAIYRI